MTDSQLQTRQELTPEQIKGAAIDSQLMLDEGGLVFKSMDDVARFAKWVVVNSMAPKCYTTPGQVVVAMQTGAEAGLTKMASIRAIYVVNNVPSWTTEASRALVKRGHFDVYSRKVTPVLMPGTDIEEGVWHSHTDHSSKNNCTDECYGWCETHPIARNGEKARYEFTVGDAKTAGLWGKSGPWQTYPFRMLTHRATGFHLRDTYGGVMLGLATQEEVQDWPQEAFRRKGEGQLASGDAPAPGSDPLFAKGAEVVDVAPEPGPPAEERIMPESLFPTAESKAESLEAAFQRTANRLFDQAIDEGTQLRWADPASLEVDLRDALAVPRDGESIPALDRAYLTPAGEICIPSADHDPEQGDLGLG